MSTKRGRCHLKGWPGARSKRVPANKSVPTQKQIIEAKRRWFQRKVG